MTQEEMVSDFLRDIRTLCRKLQQQQITGKEFAAEVQNLESNDRLPEQISESCRIQWEKLLYGSAVYVSNPSVRAQDPEYIDLAELLKLAGDFLDNTQDSI